MNLINRIESALSVFLTSQREKLVDIDLALSDIADAAERFILGGGKRIRPAFAYWGYRGCGGVDNDAIVTCVSSLELLQASALMHDDLMDDSDTRRGEPSVHQRFANVHKTARWAGDPAGFGSSAAILLGDLCLTWSDEMFTRGGMASDAVMRARSDFDAMRTEVSAGQYLDVLTAAQRDITVNRAIKVARYKSAKYTIERPLLIGAALADGSIPVREFYSDYGLPLGEAFQLRDDVLGVFGDPSETGKPAGDDLREGKYTYLIACAYENTDERGVSLLNELLGSADLDEKGVELLREIITESNALRQTEQRIDLLASQTENALSRGQQLVPAEVFLALKRLSEAAIRRKL